MKGYNAYVDLWSIGILLFELICGYLPFGNDYEDPYEIYKVIIKGQFSFPNFINDKDTINFVNQLLSKIPEVRLGGSYHNLKKNKWFNEFQWVYSYSLLF
jgi:cGMP-dependent protein kinase